MYSEDGGSKLLGNIDIYIPIYVSLHPHRIFITTENLKSHTEIAVFQHVTPCTEHSTIMSLITEAVAGVTSQMQPASTRKWESIFPPGIQLA